MKRMIAALAKQIGAVPRGDTDFEVEALTALNEANHTAICPLFNKHALDRAPALPGAVLADDRTAETALSRGVRAALIHEKPVLGLAALIDIFFPEEAGSGAVHPTAFVHADACLHPTVSVGPQAVIEADVAIGEGSVIGAGAVICSGSSLGRRVRIGPGAVIGHEGFGFSPTPEGLVKIRQVGRVVVEDDVEIGANACVDRGTLGTTRIGTGSKLDNLVQIGHNARIGRFVILAGQAGIAGSAVIEDRAMLGGQVGVADHLTVGANAMVAAKSGVTADVPANAVVAGYPAMPRIRWLRFFAKAAIGRTDDNPKMRSERRRKDEH